MATLNRHEQEAIASLLSHPGYLRLLDLMDSSERVALEELADEPDQTKLLRGMRWWQFLHKVHNWLAETPATVAAELDRLREDGQLDSDLVYSRDHAWAMRFSAPQADEPQDPASI